VGGECTVVEGYPSCCSIRPPIPTPARDEPLRAGVSGGEPSEAGSRIARSSREKTVCGSRRIAAPRSPLLFFGTEIEDERLSGPHRERQGGARGSTAHLLCCRRPRGARRSRDLQSLRTHGPVPPRGRLRLTPVGDHLLHERNSSKKQLQV
jgi:hypothetical protein